MKIILCECCQIERKEIDFLNSTLCYKCVLKKKLESILPKKNEIKICGICNHSIPKNRWVYCSKECADVAEMKRQKKYWIWNL